MSDPDAADAVEETAEDADPDDAEHDGEEEPPEIEEEDQANLPDDLAAAAEETTATDGETDADGDGDAEDADDTADAESGESDASQGTTSQATHDSYGDLYAKTLVSVTNAAIDEHGKPGAEKTDYEAARELGIPDHADRLMNEMGIGEDMPPGQALMASSAVFVLMNVSAKTDLPSQMMGDLNL